MNKLIITLTLIGLFVIQKTNGQIIRNIGLESGVSISKQKWIYTNNSYKNFDRLCLNINLNAEFFNHKYFTLKTALGYIQKGQNNEEYVRTVDNPDSIVLQNYDTQFNYFYFSPQLKIRKEFNNIMPYFVIGPRIDYLLSYKSTLNLSEIDKDINKIIFGVNFGFGLEYRINKISINTEFTDFYDFTNIIETQSIENNSSLEVKNNSFSISLGIKYYLN